MRTSLVALVACTAFGCHHGEPPEEEEPAGPVRVTCAPVTQATVDNVVDVTGVVAPPPRLDATISSPVAGRIGRVFVEEGDSVAAGAVLATVEDPALPAGSAEATADVARARASKLAAEQDLARQQRLVTSGIGAQRDLDEARARAAAAAAELDAATARAGFAAKNNARRELRAPHAGVVLQVAKRTGESVDGTSATPVARVADVSTLELHAQLAASTLATLHDGMPATVRLAGSTADLAGKVVRVAPAVDPATLLGGVRIELAGHHTIPVGSAAAGAIVTGTHPGLLVPSSALRRSTVGSDEVVVCDGAVARVRTVTVGQRRDGTVEIAQGIAAGERVVTDHVLGLEDGRALVTGGTPTP